MIRNTGVKGGNSREDAFPPAPKTGIVVETNASGEDDVVCFGKKVVYLNGGSSPCCAKSYYSIVVECIMVCNLKTFVKISTQNLFVFLSGLLSVNAQGTENGDIFINDAILI